MKLYVSARRRLTRHRALVHDAHTGPGRDDREARIAFVTIEMLNLWTNFMRSYYLSCMYSAVSRRGIYIKAQGARQTENQALGFAVRYWRPRATPQANGSWQSRDEPTWHDPNHLIPIMRAQGLSNLADFEAAFSTGERTFLDLPVFRNYFGHRNGRSQIAAQNLVQVPIEGGWNSSRGGHVLRRCFRQSSNASLSFPPLIYGDLYLGPYYGIAATRRPTDILLSRPLRRHQPLILDWMDHIVFTIEYLCT